MSAVVLNTRCSRWIPSWGRQLRPHSVGWLVCLWCFLGYSMFLSIMTADIRRGFHTTFGGFWVALLPVALWQGFPHDGLMMASHGMTSAQFVAKRHGGGCKTAVAQHRVVRRAVQPESVTDCTSALVLKCHVGIAVHILRRRSELCVVSNHPLRQQSSTWGRVQVVVLMQYDMHRHASSCHWDVVTHVWFCWDEQILVGIWCWYSATSKARLPTRSVGRCPVFQAVRVGYGVAMKSWKM